MTVSLFDANCRVGPFPWGDIPGDTVPELLARMDRIGIDRALVSHTLAWQHDPPTGNRRLVEEVAGAPRLRACWVALPAATAEQPPPAEFAAAAVAAGVAAIRAYPADHGFGLADADFAGCLAACAEAGLPLVVERVQTDWSAVLAVATAHPTLAVIVTEIGYRVLRRAAAVLDRAPNVYLDLADLANHEGLEWLCQRYGGGRLVFGTGGPLRDPGEAVARLLWSEVDDDTAVRIGHSTLDGLVPAVPAVSS